jgi:hypothetical protein
MSLFSTEGKQEKTLSMLAAQTSQIDALILVGIGCGDWMLGFFQSHTIINQTLLAQASQIDRLIGEDSSDSAPSSIKHCYSTNLTDRWIDIGGDFDPAPSSTNIASINLTARC